MVPGPPLVIGGHLGHVDEVRPRRLHHARFAGPRVEIRRSLPRYIDLRRERRRDRLHDIDDVIALTVQLQHVEKRGVRCCRRGN